MTELKSKGKLNLFLHVTGKRHDGYHLLDSLLMFTDDLYDTMEISEASDNKIEVRDQWQSKVVGPNILEKVLNKFQKIATTPKFHITIKKNVPVGAGMGGGSSNAAALVRFLFSNFAPHVSEDRIIDFGTSIGADVPVCIYSKKAYFNGIGEILSPIISMPDLYAIIIYPDISISTQEIYGKGFKKYHDQINHYSIFTSPATLWQYLENTNNDLFGNITDSHPLLTHIIDAMIQLPNCQISRMTGSGSACFGLFETKNDAESGAKSLQKKFPNYPIYTTKLS